MTPYEATKIEVDQLTYDESKGRDLAAAMSPWKQEDVLELIDRVTMVRQFRAQAPKEKLEVKEDANIPTVTQLLLKTNLQLVDTFEFDVVKALGSDAKSAVDAKVVDKDLLIDDTVEMFLVSPARARALLRHQDLVRKLEANGGNLEWVSMSEKKPEQGAEVAYFFDKVGGNIGTYNGGHHFSGLTGFITDDVTHWAILT